MLNLSNRIKQRFVKDFNLPVGVLKEPYFTYTLQTIEPHFNTNEKLKLLMNALEILKSEENFFLELDRIISTITQKIKVTNAYERLQYDSLDKYSINCKSENTQKDIYDLSNVNKTFLSIDIVKANFNVLQYYDPELTLGYKTYDDLISNISDIEYFRKSKYIRQVIFGGLLPKKQKKLQRYITHNIKQVLHESMGIALNDFISNTSDEILFHILFNNDKDAPKLIEAIKNNLNNNPNTQKFKDWVRIEIFTLKSIGNKPFFIKENIINQTIDFKKIPKIFFLQVYKKFLNKPINANDKIFYHEGYLSEFIETIFDEN